ncbi:hypothetical protein NO995_11530 [Aestuariibaculum sp. M13]|uniref:hypothetical protein n=1 Tax=Aestuariibaculum sp. M13 TaxID=2967132 RepID=UPI00215A02B9|nr:hypothetical protein [Aestuariibaculum sp. M13]MCR8668315.1 hypothetical protein [Aestuariibaculum sp. M13]
MKPFKNKFARAYISLRLSKAQSVSISIILSLLVLSLSVSCSYYNVNNVATTQEEISRGINKFNQAEKYVILHFDNNVQWHLSKMVINEDQQFIEGVLKPVSGEHVYFSKVYDSRKAQQKSKDSIHKKGGNLKPKDTLQKSVKTRDSKRVHRYNRYYSKPLNEVHFYIKNNKEYKNLQSVSIPLSDITRISVNDKNTGRAIVNVVIGYVATVFLATLLVFALKSSCPFVYVRNGEVIDFVGELYPGTITPNMQKDDYLPMPNFELDGEEYIVKVTNQLKEIQYTDQLQLIAVQHKKDLNVLLDSKGHLQTFQNLEGPKKILFDGELVEATPILKKDQDVYAFNTLKVTESSTREMILEFDKPADIKYAKLYITAKNSVWLDYIFGKFNEQFGSYYKTFQKKQQNIPAEGMNKWLNEQHIPLSVYVKQSDVWVLVERINTVGPMTMRNLVVPIQCNNISGDKLQVKFETGFNFWEVDYVAVDFTDNLSLNQEYIKPSLALDQLGKNVTKLLVDKDEIYLKQPNIGDEVEVYFPVNKVVEEELTQTFFLKNRGYYNYIRDYTGVPDFDSLKSFREKNTFTRFSEQQYFNFVNFDLNTLAYHE